MTNISKILFDIEKRLWTNDPDYYAETFTEDATLVFPETGYIDLSTAVEAIRNENEEGRRWSDVVFVREKFLEISPEVAIITYHVKAKWNVEVDYIEAIATSVYQLKDDRWKLVFSPTDRSDY